LKSERDLGPFTLPEKDPDYPVDYVLDGQQRLTSIFGTFQTELTPIEGRSWPRVYFDLQGAQDPEETQFVAFDGDTFDSTRYFPLRVIFDPVA
ncbi:MAG: hypothetical protein ABR562_09690, partial [Thermoplasmatota archaeon]